MKQQFSFSLLSLVLLPASAMAQVPHIFSPNTPAKATEVNENFDFLASKSMGANLEAGRRIVTVDCSSDAAALNKAYIENVNYRDLAFAIKGACYGDIRVVRNLDGENNWTGQKVQVAGQKVSIFPQEGQSASLIPNDLSGSVTIWGSFGGGLYLSDLTVQLAAGDTGAGFSRNSHGSLYNVTIQGPNTASGFGAWVQEGAQVYITNTTFLNVDTGIRSYNGAAIRFAGNNSITAANMGMSLNGSVVRNRGLVSSTATTALELDSGTDWHGPGRDVNVAGSVFIKNGSTFFANNLNAAGHDITYIRSSGQFNNVSANYLSLHHSNVESESITIANNLDVNHNSSFVTGSNASSAVNVYVNEQSTAYLNNITITTDLIANSVSNLNVQSSVLKNVQARTGSKLTISNTSVSGNFDIAENANVDATAVIGTANVWLEKGGFIFSNNSTFENVHLRRSSKAHLNTSTVNTGFDAMESSYLLAEDVTFAGGTLSVHNSQAFINGTTKLPLSKLSCNGLAMVQYEGADLLNEAPNSNCLDNRAMDTLKTLLKANHPAIPN